MEWVWIVLAYAAFPLCLGLGRAIDKLMPFESRVSKRIDTGPDEPCWTEEIGSDDRYLYARSQCVNEELIEMDARMRRGDYPFNPNVG